MSKYLGPKEERQRLCLQLLLHAALHDLEIPLNEKTVFELCTELNLSGVTHEKRVQLLLREATRLIVEGRRKL